MAWAALASLAGKSGGQSSTKNILPQTPVQVNSFGLNLGSFLPQQDLSSPSGGSQQPLFQPPNQEEVVQGSVTQRVPLPAASAGGIPQTYLLIGGGVLLLLLVASKRRR